MGKRKFVIGEKVRIIKGDLFFYRGQVVDYNLGNRKYKVLIPMIGTKRYRANQLKPPELARKFLKE